MDDDDTKTTQRHQNQKWSVSLTLSQYLGVETWNGDSSPQTQTRVGVKSHSNQTLGT